jgi:RNA polymerase sigma factor (sigma-70 family)
VNTLRRIGEEVSMDTALVVRATLADSGDLGAAWSDATVIELSLGEPERFAEVFDRYHAEIHGYVSRRLGTSLADDIASETFLIAFARRQRYDLAHGDARPWLYGIASNLIARHRRAEARHYRAMARAVAVDAVDGDTEPVAGRIDATTMRGRLAAALVEIRDRDREILLLVAWAQLSCEEAARALGIPAGTARSRLNRARRRARAALAATGKDDGRWTT